MAARSNGHYLPLLPAAPLPDSGWAVRVYAHTDLMAYRAGTARPIAQVFRYTALDWSPELSGLGVGSLTLSATDPLWQHALANGDSPSALYRNDNLWVVTEDGQWRGEFFGVKVDKPQVTSAEHAGRTITISGPGTATCLARARVMSPYWPATTPKGKIGVHQFTNVPVMAAWLQLLWAAQRRRVIPYVTCRFDEVRDTAGTKWADTPAAKPKNTAGALIGNALFATDSSALNTAGKAAVDKMVKKIAPITYPSVHCEGHADSRGTVAHNYQLGLDRANTVRNAILTKRPLARITVSSQGENKPAFKNDTAANRAKNRRVVVTYQSAADAADTLYTPERGTTLLNLLQQLTSGQAAVAESRGPVHCEWLMGKGFELQVQDQIGVDRSKQVVYHQGSPYLAAEGLTADRTDVANVISVQNDQHVYKVVEDAASIARWGRRESYTRLEGTYADNIHAQVAETQREALAQEVAQTTLVVNAGAHRVPFRDFGLGDWIGVSRQHGTQPSTVERQRVVAISVHVDADGRVTYELTLSSVRQHRVSWLKLQVDALINRRQGIRSFISDDEPTGALPGDLWTPATELEQ